VEKHENRDIIERNKKRKTDIV